MRHFVAYHSVDIMGKEYTPGDDFSFISRKSLNYLTQTLGNTVWAFRGKKNDFRKTDFSLFAVFYPEDVYPDEEEEKLIHIWSSNGDYFDPPIEVNQLAWFQALLKQQSNFSLGINEIKDPSIIQQLEDCYYRSGIIPSHHQNNDSAEDDTITEGGKKTLLVNTYERSAKGRSDCIAHHGMSCAVCGFNFADFYGDIGSNFIHVHHRLPLSERNSEYVLDPIKDMVPVCPNCHAMLHKRNPAFSIEELREIITENNGSK